MPKDPQYLHNRAPKRTRKGRAFKYEHEQTFSEVEIQKMFDIYKENIDEFYKGKNTKAARYARMALNAMIPLIKTIRSEIQQEKKLRLSLKGNQ